VVVRETKFRVPTKMLTLQTIPTVEASKFLKATKRIQAMPMAKTQLMPALTKDLPTRTVTQATRTKSDSTRTKSLVLKASCSFPMAKP